MDRKHTFNDVAEEYAAVRPGYPSEVYDLLAERAGNPDTARLLEVGCGPGTATPPFAERGYAVTCLEHGPDLVRVARARLAGFPRVEVVQGAFESWDSGGAKFSLIYAASVWHLLDPEVRCDRAADLLTPGGTLGLFAHFPTEVFREGQDAYRRHAPELAKRVSLSIDDRVAAGVGRLEASGRFSDIEVHRIPWTGRYSTEQYLRLVGTYSDHRVLPHEQRAALFAGLRDAVEAAGGEIARNYETVLYRIRV
jgi:SAM-dependent methyltransferase